MGNIPGQDGGSVGTIRDGRDARNGRNNGRSGSRTVVSSNKYWLRVFLLIASAALIERGYMGWESAIARCLLMWSISGMTVAMLGVAHEKKSVASLKS